MGIVIQSNYMANSELLRIRNCESLAQLASGSLVLICPTN